jgi:uncharacterized protein
MGTREERRKRGNARSAEGDAAPVADERDEGAVAGRGDGAGTAPTGAVVAAPVALRKWPGPQPGTEAARRGGLAMRARYGRAYFTAMGTKGGRANRERNGVEYDATIGRRGGQRTKETQGVEHYRRIGRIGGQRRTKHSAMAEHESPVD